LGSAERIAVHWAGGEADAARASIHGLDYTTKQLDSLGLVGDDVK
jgi:hypothetical protein